MERPEPETPLDIRPFLDLVDDELYPSQSGGINMVGDSTTAVLLVFGPDHDECKRLRTV